MSTSDPQARVVGDRYRLLRRIGSGGMGTVWLGLDELLGREVAVKEVRFPPGLGDGEQQELRQRTLREARATARLSHPSVVTTYDVVEADGRPWIVMELLSARSLSQVLRDSGPLPPHRVAEIGLALLGALEVSHGQGVVHRDVKPGNVLMTDDGRPVLTDFGIATVAGDPSLTSTGVVLGSPAYMSPERARGHRPGPEADMWSLGATLYAAAEGRPPYDSDNAIGTLTAVISDPVDPPTVSGPLAEAILGLLEKEPGDRLSAGRTRSLLQSAAADRATGPTPAPPAAALALDRAARTEALPVDPDPAQTGGRPRPAADEPPPGPPEGGRRRPVALVVAGIAVLALLVALTAFAMFDDDDRPTTGQAPSTSPSPPSQSPTTTQPSTTASSPSPSDTLPAGFGLYEDPRGFSLAVPKGWERVSDAGSSRVDFREPGGSRFLRLDSTTDPAGDPKKDWQEQEKAVKDELPKYKKIQIEEVGYRDYPAADWEFTFGERGTHVLNRGFVAGDRGYAIYLSTPESQWEASRGIFETATDTFEPAG